MPRTRNQDAPLASMGRLIRGYFGSGEQLAAVLGCTGNTARRRLNNPKEITLGEIIILNQRGHISKEELLGALKW